MSIDQPQLRAVSLSDERIFPVLSATQLERIVALGERRLVTLMGCVKTKEQAEQMEKAVLLVDDVMGEINFLGVGTAAKPKYEVAK